MRRVVDRTITADVHEEGKSATLITIKENIEESHLHPAVIICVTFAICFLTAYTLSSLIKGETNETRHHEESSIYYENK
jgi:hypothetical protein